MKKNIIVITIVISLFVVTGCNKNDEVIKLDLDKIESSLTTLNDGKFSLTMVNPDVMEEYSDSLTYIYDFEYEEIFGLSSESIDINDSVIKYNKDNNDLLAIIKSSDNEAVELSMDKFCSDCLKEEWNGYLIYILSSDNDSVLEKIKNTTTPIFNEMMDADGEFFESTTGISEDLLEEYLMKVPMMMTSSATYIILNPVDENVDEVKSLMDEYMESLESTWEMYLPAQYDLVKSRLFEEYGEYLIYIISSDNELVLDAIKEN